MVFLHTTVSFCVAQFRSLFLSWLCSLSLLSTLRLLDVEKIKVSVSILPLGRRRPLWHAPVGGDAFLFRYVNWRTLEELPLVAMWG